MLKELNSIANGLLGLHGYPVRPAANPEASLKGKRSTIRANESVSRTAKPGVVRAPAATVHARPHFSW